MTCEEIEELAGAYALDAISPEERTAIDEHLAGCPHCRQLIQELQRTAELLPLAVPAREPGVALKERIFTAIEAEASPRPIPLYIRPQQQRKRARKSSWFTPLVAAVAACFVLLSSALTAWNVSLEQQLAYLRAQQQVGVQTYAIQGTTNAPDASGQLVYLPAQHSTLVTLRGLPATSGTQVYQGWLLHCQQPTSIGLLNVTNGVASLTYPGKISSYEVAAISLEPGPAASPNAPKGQILATGKLTNPDRSCNG